MCTRVMLPRDEKQKQVSVTHINTKEKTGRVNLSKLKIWASGLSIDSALRSILLLENDTMTSEEFLMKMGTWLKLAEIESRRQKR